LESVMSALLYSYPDEYNAAGLLMSQIVETPNLTIKGCHKL
jgi:hypothetical protein